MKESQVLQFLVSTDAFGSIATHEITAMRFAPCSAFRLLLSGGYLLALCIKNPGDLGESLAERSRRIVMVFGQTD